MLGPRNSTADASADLFQIVAALERRVTALEARLAASAVGDPVLPDVEPDSGDPSVVPVPAAGPRLPAMGRAVLVVAGAFLLRALTDTQVLTGTVGVALGLAYAVLIIILANRQARAGQRAEAGLSSLAAVIVVYPLLWETSTRLGFLPPHAAAAALVGVTGFGLIVTIRHDLYAVAWVFVAAALITTAGLCWLSAIPELFGGAAVVLGIGTLWIAYLRGWCGPRWPAAALANLLVLLLAFLAINEGDPAPGRPVPVAGATLVLAFALPTSYLASFFARALQRRHAASAFEILQTLGCVLVGVLGAVVVLRSRGHSLVGMGAIATVVGATSYALAFAFVRRKHGRGLNFFYFAWLGCVLTLIGTAFVMPAAAIPYLWGVLGLAAASTGGVFDRWTLRLHGAAYLLGAAAYTGLPVVAANTFLAPVGQTWHHLHVSGLVVWLLAAVGYGVLAFTQRGCELRTWERLPRALLALLALVGAGSVLVVALVNGMQGAVPGQGPAMVAAVRTGVITASAIALAAVSRGANLPELAWFVNPLLIVAGVKLLAEDLRRGTPVSLCVAFGCFGLALILSPRLRWRRVSHGDDR